MYLSSGSEGAIRSQGYPSSRYIPYEMDSQGATSSFSTFQASIVIVVDGILHETNHPANLGSLLIQGTKWSRWP